MKVQMMMSYIEICILLQVGSFKDYFQWEVLGSQPFHLSVCFYVFVLTCEGKSSTNKPEGNTKGLKHFFFLGAIS